MQFLINFLIFDLIETKQYFLEFKDNAIVKAMIANNLVLDQMVLTTEIAIAE